MRRRALLAAVVVVGVVADQASKAWAEVALANGRTIQLLPTVEFDLSYNSGFSFNTGAGYGQLIGVVVAVVAVFLARLMMRATTIRRAVLFAVILGGALGNLWDRLFRASEGLLSGEVVDFIDVSWFAVFNVADSLAVGGVLVLIVTELLTSSK